MPQLFSSLPSALPVEVLAAILLYAAGYATNELFDIINRKRRVRMMMRRTEVAFQAIELTEKKFPGLGQGAKKLKFAAHYLLANSKIRKYKDAQNLILKCFPLTNFSRA